jgi:hypothetical protein
VGVRSAVDVPVSTTGAMYRSDVVAMVLVGLGSPTRYTAAVALTPAREVAVGEPYH